MFLTDIDGIYTRPYLLYFGQIIKRNNYIRTGVTEGAPKNRPPRQIERRHRSAVERDIFLTNPNSLAIIKLLS
jgi:hypothetical protein